MISLSLNKAEIRKHIVELSAQETSIRKNAVQSLMHFIAADPQNRIIIAQAGTIPPLITLLSDNDTRIRADAAYAPKAYFVTQGDASKYLMK